MLESLTVHAIRVGAWDGGWQPLGQLRAEVVLFIGALQEDEGSVAQESAESLAERLLYRLIAEGVVQVRTAGGKGQARIVEHHPRVVAVRQHPSR